MTAAAAAAADMWSFGAVLYVMLRRPGDEAGAEGCLGEVGGVGAASALAELDPPSLASPSQLRAGQPRTAPAAPEGSMWTLPRAGLEDSAAAPPALVRLAERLLQVRSSQTLLVLECHS